MLCPRGHATTSEGKKLRLFSRYTCDVCQERVSHRGGFYHKCTAGCDFRVCGICKKEAEKSNYIVEPCTFTFPSGLGPFEIRSTRLQSHDLNRATATGRRRDDMDMEDADWALRESFFQKSASLRQCWSALHQNGVAMEDSGGQRFISVQVSPVAPVNLSLEVRAANRIPDIPGIMVAWMYALQLEWPMIFSMIDQREDDAAAEWNLLKVGGFVYLQPSEDGRPQVVCANSIAFHPNGCMQFSAAQPWCSEWTSKLVESRRFHKVTAQKWAAAGACYVCWVCPEEKLLRPGARHGGFAFLFHELDEEDVAGRDRFFEVVGKPLGAAYAGASAGSPVQASMAHESTLCAMSFRVVGEWPATSRHMEASQRRCFKAASNGRWALLAHILAEFPQLATAKDDSGQTVLHCIALGRPKTRRAAELLRLVHSHHGDLEAKNNEGQRAYELGDLVFKAQACEIWGLSPDLFADPEVWFDYWDVNKDGHLSPEELIPALTAAYEVGDLGRQWIESYVNTHYREMAALDPNALLTKNAFLGNDGLLHKLQSSEEFISLRGQEDSPRIKMPALFRTEGRKKPTAADKEAVTVFSARLEEFRKKFGWVPGHAAPSSSRSLQVPAPFAGGDIDPRRRLKAAERMLAVSFAKTTARSGKEWLKGFSIEFAGDDAGIDHGGLTKAWVQEVGHALWGSEAFFDMTSAGSFFKPDSTTDMLLHAFHVPSESLYRWLGRFLAYALYQQCVLDCALSPWALRWLMRVTETQAALPALLKEAAGSWRRDGSDGSRIATISGSVLLSHMDDVGLPPETPLRVSGQHIEATFDGETVTAVMSEGRLHWSDGDVWMRCSEPVLLAPLPVWEQTPTGDDQLLEDLATMDPAMANSLWRVRYEMPEEDLQWLTFSYGGKELVPGGDDLEVTADNRAEYVRLCCKAALLYTSQRALQAFGDGFFEVLPSDMFVGAPVDIFQWLLLGNAHISDTQMEKLAQIVIPEGLVPKHLKDAAEVRDSASWIFEIIRRSDDNFRSRLFEFWTGNGRLPLGGVEAIEPKPRIQVMVSQEKQYVAVDYVWEVQVSGGWRQYSAHMSGNLNNMFEAGLRMCEFQSGQSKIIIDLGANLQINTRTGERRRVRRRPLQQTPQENAPVIVKRIESWPKTRLPEGHTCGNELWVPLCDSEEELVETTSGRTQA